MSELRPEASELLQLAYTDEEAAAVLASHGGLEAIACFHCQQAAEKALKALLSHLDRDYPPTHDLIRLLQLAEPGNPALHRHHAGLEILRPYAVDVRYFLSDRPTTEELRDAQHIVRELLITIQTILKAEG